MFERRMHEITEDVMLKWRLLVEEGRKVGQAPRPPFRDLTLQRLNHSEPGHVSLVDGGVTAGMTGRSPTDDAGVFDRAARRCCFSSCRALRADSFSFLA